MGYSALLMDHFTRPRNGGPLEDADAEGVAGVPFQGNCMVLRVRLDGDRIAEARFQCHGCGPTIACGSYLTTLLLGRTASECANITVDTLAEALAVPPHKASSPALAVDALEDLVRSLGLGGA